MVIFYTTIQMFFLCMLCMCVLYGLKNTKLLFPYKALNYWFLYKRKCIYCTMWTGPFNIFQLNFRANAELVTRLHIALHTSHAAVSKINPKIYGKIHPSIYMSMFCTAQQVCLFVHCIQTYSLLFSIFGIFSCHLCLFSLKNAL